MAEGAAAAVVVVVGWRGWSPGTEKPPLISRSVPIMKCIR